MSDLRRSILGVAAAALGTAVAAVWSSSNGRVLSASVASGATITVVLVVRTVWLMRRRERD